MLTGTTVKYGVRLGGSKVKRRGDGLIVGVVLPKFGSEPIRTRFKPEPNRRFQFRFRIWPNRTPKSSSGFGHLQIL